MNACLDVDGLADCLIGYYQGKAGEEILDTYARVRRDIFMKYVNARSIKNLDRVAKTDPWTVLETDKFFGIIRELNKDKQALKDFLLVSLRFDASLPVLTFEQKVSSIEYDFKQHYDREPVANGLSNGTVEQEGKETATAQIKQEV